MQVEKLFSSNKSTNPRIRPAKPLNKPISLINEFLFWLGLAGPNEEKMNPLIGPG